MKLLLIGPYPPPHGGVSVHIASARKQLDGAGIPCRVLNTDPRAPESPCYITVRNALDLAVSLARHALDGWTFHLHTNGHNRKSWLVALACGLAGRAAPACFLTLHSGMAPRFLSGSLLRRGLARLVCLLYARIFCVSPEIRRSVLALGIAPSRIDLMPAFLPVSAADLTLPRWLQSWFAQHRPVLSTVLSFRPEYGFELLVRSLSEVRRRFPRLGCVVMGSGEQQAAAENHLRQLAMEREILLLGDVPHHACLALIANSDLFVRATLEDGDSISVREALSFGIPVVASDTGFRPDGVLLFQKGNVGDLISKIERSLSAARRPAAKPQPAFPVRSLPEIYGEVAA
jgi:glycogen(starch) synthase